MGAAPKKSGVFKLGACAERSDSYKRARSQLQPIFVDIVDWPIRSDKGTYHRKLKDGITSCRKKNFYILKLEKNSTTKNNRVERLIIRSTPTKQDFKIKIC